MDVICLTRLYTLYEVSVTWSVLRLLDLTIRYLIRVKRFCVLKRVERLQYGSFYYNYLFCLSNFSK